MVIDYAGLESLSIWESTANAVHQVAGFIMTCPILITDKSFISNIINKKLDIINHPEENLSRHSHNLIYLLSYKNCEF